MAEVLNAPKRRVDNEVSRLSDSVYVLQMHCKIIEDISKKYRSSLLRSRILLASTAVSTVILPTAAMISFTLFPDYGIIHDLSAQYILGYPIIAILGGTASTFSLCCTYSVNILAFYPNGICSLLYASYAT